MKFRDNSCARRLSVAGIVLCGGRSRRMGRPKAWLPFAGETMLSRVTRVLRQAVEPIVVVAAQVEDVPRLPSDVLLVRDEEEGLGPLAGLAAGLKFLEGRADAAYLSSCDVPLCAWSLCFAWCSYWASTKSACRG